MKLVAETQNVAWKHNEDEGIWAALPTSLFGQSGDPLLVGKFVWLQSWSPGVKSQTSEIKTREKQAEKRASTPANGVATSGDKEAHLDDFLVVWSGRGGGRTYSSAAACQLQSLSHIGFYERQRWSCYNQSTNFFPLTLWVGLLLRFYRLDPCACARLFPLSLGRSVGL